MGRDRREVRRSRRRTRRRRRWERNEKQNVQKGLRKTWDRRIPKLGAVPEEASWGLEFVSCCADLKYFALPPPPNSQIKQSWL